MWLSLIVRYSSEECGLCYNTVDVAPQLGELVIFQPSTAPNPQVEKQPVDMEPLTVPNPQVEKQLVGGIKQTKPFKVDGKFFWSIGDYVAYRDSIGATRINTQRLRDRLKAAGTTEEAPTRYLSPDEIDDALL